MTYEQEISWGSLGADPINRIVLDGVIGGHSGHADISFSGDDEPDEFADYLGWNPFKAVSRAVKRTVKKVARGAGNLVRNPVKFTTRGVQNVAHTVTTGARTVAYAAKVAKPYIHYGAIGASIAFPPGAPIAMGIEKATATVAAADGKIPKIPAAKRNDKKAIAKQAAAIARRSKARKLANNTEKMARAGNKEAQAALKALKAVRKARTEAAKKGFRRAWTVTKKGYLHRVK